MRLCFNKVQVLCSHCLPSRLRSSLKNNTPEAVCIRFSLCCRRQGWMWSWDRAISMSFLVAVIMTDQDHPWFICPHYPCDGKNTCIIWSYLNFPDRLDIDLLNRPIYNPLQGFSEGTAQMLHELHDAQQQTPPSTLVVVVTHEQHQQLLLYLWGDVFCSCHCVQPLCCSIDLSLTLWYVNVLSCCHAGSRDTPQANQTYCI